MNLIKKFDIYYGKPNKLIIRIFFVLIIQIIFFEIKIEYKRYKTRKKIEIETESNIANQFILEQEFELLKKNFYFDSNKIQLNQTHRNGKKFCNQVPSELIGQLNVKDSLPFDYWPTANYRKEFAEYLEMGGIYKPHGCEARHRVAIIIPFKNRLLNLNLFIYHMHPILQRQQLEYRIFVVEQYNDELFNKGVLNNAAFLEIFKMYNLTVDLNNLMNFPFDCIVYHDVDLLPEGNFFLIKTDFIF